MICSLSGRLWRGRRETISQVIHRALCLWLSMYTGMLLSPFVDGFQNDRRRSLACFLNRGSQERRDGKHGAV